MLYVFSDCLTNFILLIEHRLVSKKNGRKQVWSDSYVVTLAFPVSCDEACHGEDIWKSTGCKSYCWIPFVVDSAWDVFRTQSHMNAVHMKETARQEASVKHPNSTIFYNHPSSDVCLVSSMQNFCMLLVLKEITLCGEMPPISIMKAKICLKKRFCGFEMICAH